MYAIVQASLHFRCCITATRLVRRTLNSYFDYYHRSRTHLSLGKDSRQPRAIQPTEMGFILVVPQVGGLHHRYERRAA
jgi:putative transposase